MVKFEIKHKTDNEKEYNAVMEIIRHYEILCSECNHKNKYGKQLDLNHVQRVCQDCGKILDVVNVPESAGVVF